MSRKEIDIMVQAIFQTIGEVITNFAQILGNGFQSLVSIFYTTGEGGGLTLVGTLSLVGLGIAIVYWAFRLVRSLMHARG